MQLCYDLYKITVHIFEARAVGGAMCMTENKLKLSAICRNYELFFRARVSRPTMQGSGMNLRKSKALRPPPTKIAERLRLSAPP